MNRAALIRVVHAMARRQALDEETRRALYRRLTGCATLTDMTEAQIAAVAAELRRLAPARPKARKAEGTGDSAGAAEGGIRTASPKAHVRLVYALWWRLAQAGLVAQEARTSAARRKALNAFLNARFATELNGLTTEADFLSAALAAKAAEALKAIAARAGLKLETSR